MTTAKRQYIPTAGSRVRMPLMGDYAALGLPAWSVLITDSIEGSSVKCHRELTADKEHDGEHVTVPLDRIEPPVGWRERYTIHVAPEKVEEVLGWLKRGIAVRFSQYIGDGSTVFQPLDNSGTPHWKYTELTDAIPAEQTRDLIQIVRFEQVYDAFIDAPCYYCNGTGVHTANKSLEEQTASAQHCQRCGTHTGFSFTEPWHHTTQPHEQCPEVHPPGWCWPCHGSGKGAGYISSMKGKERAAAIKTLEAKGWKVRYEESGRHWCMERETVVKDFGVGGVTAV